MKLYAKRVQGGFLEEDKFEGRIDLVDAEEVQLIRNALEMALKNAKEQFEYYQDIVESPHIEVQTNDVGYDEIEGYNSYAKLIEKTEEMIKALKRENELVFE